MKGEETGETYGKTGSETVGADGESRWLFNGFLIFVDGRVCFCFLSPKHHFWLGGSCVIHWPFTLSLLPHFLHHAGFCCTNFEDPGSPKLRMVSWNLNTLRFISVIGHPNRSSSDVRWITISLGSGNFLILLKTHPRCFTVEITASKFTLLGGPFHAYTQRFGDRMMNSWFQADPCNLFHSMMRTLAWHQPTPMLKKNQTSCPSKIEWDLTNGPKSKLLELGPVGHFLAHEICSNSKIYQHGNGGIPVGSSGVKSRITGRWGTHFSLISATKVEDNKQKKQLIKEQTWDRDSEMWCFLGRWCVYIYIY